MHSRKMLDWLAASEWYNYNSFWFLYNFIYSENYLQDTFLKKPKNLKALPPLQNSMCLGYKWGTPGGLSL